MTLLDQDCKYVMVNDSFARELGEDVSGKGLGQTHGDQGFLKIVNQFLESKERRSVIETTFGPLFASEHYVVSLTKLDAPTNHIAIVSINVEAQKRAERELKQAQSESEHSSRLATLGEMISGVAHEIRNPLAVISGRADLVKLRALKGEILDKSYLISEVEKIKEMTDRIVKIVQTVLKYGRTETEQPMDEVSIRQLVEEVVVLTNPRQSLRVSSFDSRKKCLKPSCNAMLCS